jgi:hypothetical protein
MISVLALTMLALSPVPTKIAKTSEGWQLLRDGKPYFVKGVGGTGRMDELVAAGGNSMRTWGTENAARELDDCQKHGLTLTVGIWLGHKEYFNYEDPVKVREQYENVKKDVLRLKDHPALLMWGLGNEMEIGNDTPALWKAIEDLAKLCRSLDPNHPVMTVVADLTPQKISNIKTYAPSIDLIGFNSYGGLPTLPKRLKEAGWEKPYIVTEFGPLGPWERPKTAWGAALEPTATEKAAFYRSNYDASIAGQKGWCLGSYAFLWGDKQEETPTWFGMFLPTGERTPAVDVMTYAWLGQWPKNRAPEISKFEFSLGTQEVDGGSEASASVMALDPDNDHLTYAWELRQEATQKGYAGQGETKPGVVTGYVDPYKTPAISFKAPRHPGAYRLYVTVRDGRGNAATANLPFAVR